MTKTVEKCLQTYTKNLELVSAIDNKTLDSLNTGLLSLNTGLLWYSDRGRAIRPKQDN